MQLTIELNDEIIASRPFDFAAFAVGYDLMVTGAGQTALGDAISTEMFRGTKVTSDVLSKLELHERVDLGKKAISIFFEEVSKLNNLKKNQTNNIPKISTRG